MKYIKVWCEYDIGGNFGGNNNEEVFCIMNDTLDIEELVKCVITTMTGLDELDLEGLYDWGFIDVKGWV